MADRWSSRLGFVLAAAGAAVGLGNIWRFSAVVGQNGGGAYLVPYLVSVVALAFPLLVLELAVGQSLRTDVVSAFRSVSDRVSGLGWVVVAALLAVLSYYLVLTGWVLAFFVAAVVGVELTFAGLTGSWVPLLGFGVSTVLVAGVVSLGVRRGIERVSTVAMPLVFVVLVGLLGVAVTSDGFGAGVEFFLQPRWDALNDPGVWGAAVGQTFFSLSVGQGIMLTYGSYLDDDVDVLQSAAAVTVADVAVAFLAGLVIFPLVFANGLTPTAGTELAFTTLPHAFAAMPFGRGVAIAFFGLLFIAAVTSAVAMLEVGVAALEGIAGSRTRATGFGVAAIVPFGVLAALSYSPATVSIGGEPVLDVLDETVGTLGLPVTAVLVAVVFTRFGGVARTRAAMGSRTLYRLAGWVAPTVIVVVTVGNLFGAALPSGWHLLPARVQSNPVVAVVGVGAIVVVTVVAWRVAVSRRT